MKKIILAFAFLIGSIASAAAACTGPAVMHDFPGTSFNMSLATVPDGNCGSNVALPTWAGGTLGAMANYGTSPGAVLVPGVNAFVTNTLSPGQAVMASSSPVVIASNQSAVPASQSGTWTVQPGNTPNTTSWLVNQNDGTNTALLDPCQSAAKSSLPITLATAAVKVIATGVAAKKIYVCAIDLTNNAADSVAVFEATTGTTCATSAVAVAGAGTSVATAATGYNFAANGGISKGGGGFQVMQTTVNNNDLCIAQSAATQLTGSITYVTR